MNRRQLEVKRKREDNSDEQVLSIIQSKTVNAIWVRDLKKNAAEEYQLTSHVVDKALKLLLSHGRIKEVVNIKAKTKKHYIAAEFEPSEELTGGMFYTDGVLDTDALKSIRRVATQLIAKERVSSAQRIGDFIKSKGVAKFAIPVSKIGEILNTMVFDNEIIEVKSTGLGEYHPFPKGTVCYRSASGLGPEKEKKIGNMASIPCGACPQISRCTPDGLISPLTCEYYQKWLDF